MQSLAARHPTICGGAIASSASSTPPTPIVAPPPPPDPTSSPPLRSCIQPPPDAPRRPPPPSPPHSPRLRHRLSTVAPHHHRLHRRIELEALSAGKMGAAPWRGSLAWLPGVAPWPGSLAWLPGLSSHWISPRWLCALVLGGTVGLAPYLRIGIRSFSKHTGTGMGGVGAGSAGARAEVAWRLRERQRSVERRAGSKYKGGAPARSRGGPSPLWARGALDDRTATTCQADRLHSKRCGVLGSEWGVGGRGLWGRAWSYGREGCDPG